MTRSDFQAIALLVLVAALIAFILTGSVALCATMTVAGGILAHRRTADRLEGLTP